MNHPTYKAFVNLLLVGVIFIIAIPLMIFTFKLGVNAVQVALGVSDSSSPGEYYQVDEYLPAEPDVDIFNPLDWVLWPSSHSDYEETNAQPESEALDSPSEEIPLPVEEPAEIVAPTPLDPLFWIVFGGTVLTALLACLFIIVIRQVSRRRRVVLDRLGVKRISRRIVHDIEAKSTELFMHLDEHMPFDTQDVRDNVKKIPLRLRTRDYLGELKAIERHHIEMIERLQYLRRFAVLEDRRYPFKVLVEHGLLYFEVNANLLQIKNAMEGLVAHARKASMALTPEELAANFLKVRMVLLDLIAQVQADPDNYDTERKARSLNESLGSIADSIQSAKSVPKVYVRLMKIEEQAQRLVSQSDLSKKRKKLLQARF